MYYNTSAPLQALSKTIHYGKFVVEAMFQDAPSQYEAAIKAKVNFCIINSYFLLFFKYAQVT